MIKQIVELKFLILALLCLVAYFLLTSQDLRGIFLSLFAAFLASCTIERIAKSKFEELIANRFPYFFQLTKTGLSRILYNNRLQDVYPNINDTKKLYIVMNDGKNFYSSNAEWLTKRLNESNKETYLILLKENSISQEILCDRHDKEFKQHYSNKIKETIKEFKKNKSDKSHLEIYQYDYFFTTSIVLTDTFAVVGIYRNSSGKEFPPPSFVFENDGQDSEYNKILGDIKKVILKSQLIS